MGSDGLELDEAGHLKAVLRSAERDYQHRIADLRTVLASALARAEKAEGERDEARGKVAKAGAIFAAWLFDRAEQYPNDSGIRAAFDELFRPAAEGEPFKAYEAGELDDIDWLHDFDGEVPEACAQAVEAIDALLAQLSLKQQTLDYWRLSAERTKNCGQNKVCATPPGCNRHWEARNRELTAERDTARRELEEMGTNLQKLHEEWSAERAAAQAEVKRLRKVDKACERVTQLEGELDSAARWADVARGYIDDDVATEILKTLASDARKVLTDLQFAEEPKE